MLKATQLKVAQQRHLERIKLASTPSDHTTDNQVVFRELMQRVTKLVEQLPGQRRRVFDLMS